MKKKVLTRELVKEVLGKIHCQKERYESPYVHIYSTPNLLKLRPKHSSKIHKTNEQKFLLQHVPFRGFGRVELNQF